MPNRPFYSLDERYQILPKPPYKRENTFCSLAKHTYLQKCMYYLPSGETGQVEKEIRKQEDVYNGKNIIIVTSM